MEIQLFTAENREFITEAAELLKKAFPEAYAHCALKEVDECLRQDRIAVMAVEAGCLIGFTGAIPQYGMTGWELHPIVVDDAWRGKGVGSLLIDALEKHVAKRGGITIYLGTDDELCRTSLSDTDLFEDTFDKIKDITNLNKHPYEFYIKKGYKIVGVVPDANGIGKPDIIMAKRIAQS